MTVSESMSEPASAKQIVSASGANILPSRPESVNSGRNTMTMMSTPESTGTPTSAAAR
jgi:hypothetical protein